MALDAIQAEYQSWRSMLNADRLWAGAVCHCLFSYFFMTIPGYIVTVLALAWLVAVDRAIPEVTP
jgi:hypothetical protein